MINRRDFIKALSAAAAIGVPRAYAAPIPKSEQNALAQTILNDRSLVTVLDKAKAVVKTGFSAGSSYGEVWIRDFATFIDLACQVHEPAKIRDNLVMFFRFQGDDGNIIDGFIPRKKAKVPYEFIQKKSIPDFLGHKNTVETDQESSLLIAVNRYVRRTGDKSLLELNVDGRPVLERMEMAMEFLLKHRHSKEYGLLWGATTADWGDVQPEHKWGVVLDENSHRAIDIYDNAMFILALNNLVELTDDQARKEHWTRIEQRTKDNVRRHLWDSDRMTFKPHLYLEGSPFPPDFDEDALYYHGGTAVAIQAGILSREEIAASLAAMVDNVKTSGAASIGLTVYPPYPAGYFKNRSMKNEYSYQNGGDWTWFGGRMIQTLIENGFVAEAYRELKPMTDRVINNKGFFEWYTRDNKPRGSGTFRGSAGVLGKAIQMLHEWAKDHS